MLLTLLLSETHITITVLCSAVNYIEDHSVTVGIISSMIVGSIWFWKFLRQRRAEAFFGFYSKLSLQLHELYIQLENANQLQIEDAEKGNIYSLMYTVATRKIVCSAYHEPNSNLPILKRDAEKLRETLLNTDNNVHPKGMDRRDWIGYLKVLYSFCEFLCDDKKRGTVSCDEQSSQEERTQHIEKCKELLGAIRMIQDSIDEAAY